jgi:hypothetical protein
MNPPTAGQLWLIRSADPTERRRAVAIRSRERDAWTVLDATGHNLTVVPDVDAVALRPVPGYPVPVEATWDERVRLLAGFARPPVLAAAP